MLKNKTQTISVSTLVKSYYEYKISCYLMTYPRKSLNAEYSLIYTHAQDVLCYGAESLRNHQAFT